MLSEIMIGLDNTACICKNFTYPFKFPKRNFLKEVEAPFRPFKTGFKAYIDNLFKTFSGFIKS